MREKFQFDVGFQWEILRYTVKDKHGYKALLLFKYEYFDLVEQQVIARALQRFFKRKKRVPSSATILNEELNTLFKTKDYAQNLLDDDRKNIKARVKKLYKSTLQDGDEILHKCKQFASYVEFKKTLEDVDLENFTQYEAYSKRIQKAINLGMEIEEKKGSFIVAGHQARITQRYNTEDIIPTPYRQINNLTNAGGYEKGSVIVFMDSPKKGKTIVLVNFALSYIKKRGNNLKLQGAYKGVQRAAKKVVYFDLENGETAITTRVDQSLLNKTKAEVLSHKFDDKLKKLYRQFRRYEGEIYVIRMPNGCTTDDLQKELDEVYVNFGIKFEVAILDYAALMGARSGAKEDFQRISDVYLDVKNWSKHNGFDIVITAHHVVRTAYKRRLTKYEPEDLAKCIDIERHVDALYGIQQSKVDQAQSVFRIELLEQRDGDSFGRALFWVNIKTQRMVEFTKEEEQTYNKAIEEMEEIQESSNKRETEAEKSNRIKNAHRGI